MNFVRKWLKRAIAWLAFTLAVVNLAANAVLWGLLLHAGNIGTPLDSDANAELYTPIWIFGSLLLMLWYYWKDAK